MGEINDPGTSIPVRGCSDCSWRSNTGQPHASFCGGQIGYVRVRDAEDGGVELVPPSDIPDELLVMGRTTTRLLESVKGKGETRTTSSTGGEKGVKLERHDLIPKGPLKHLAEHYGRGARKYDDHQWRNGYEFSKSIAALYRHFTDWENGIDYDTCANSNNEGCQFVDKDGNDIDWAVPGEICYNHTGGHHLDAVMWHSFTLREFVDFFPQHDDRFKRKVISDEAP